MAKGILRGGLALIALGCVAVLWWRAQEDARDAPLLQETREQALTPATPPNRLPDLQQSATERDRVDLASPATPDSHAAPSVPSMRLEGRVTLAETGLPVAGATVWNDLSKSATVSDENGRYAFEFERTGRISVVEVRATPETASVRRSLMLRIDTGDPVELDLVVHRGARIRGRVVDANNQQGVEGAKVRIWCRDGVDPSWPPDREVVTDLAGEFEATAVGSSFQLGAWANGMTMLHGLRGELAPGALVEGLVVELVPAVDLEIQCLDVGRRPIEGAEVTLSVTNHGVHTDVSRIERLSVPGRRERTDTAGRCTFLGVPQRSVEVSAGNPGFVTWSGLVKTSDSPFVVTLHRGLSLHGRVETQDGSPIAGADVKLRGPPGYSQALTAKDGSFELGGLQPGTDGLISVVAAGHAAFARAGIALDESSQPPLVLRLDPGLSIRGSVIDTQGKGVSDVRIEIRGDRICDRADVVYKRPRTVESWCGIEEVRSAQDGRFVIEGLYAGTFRLTATAPGDPTLQVPVDAISGAQDVRIVLDPGAIAQVEFRGRVRDRETGRELKAFQVNPISVDAGSGGQFEQGSEDGTFRIRGLEPGRIQVWVTSPGYAHWASGERDWAAGVHELDVSLSPARTLELTVVDADDQPVRGPCFVMARDLAGKRIDFAAGEGSVDRVFVVEGRTTALGLPAEVITLELHRGFKDAAPQSFEIDLRTQPAKPMRLKLAR